MEISPINYKKAFLASKLHEIPQTAKSNEGQPFIMQFLATYLRNAVNFYLTTVRRRLQFTTGSSLS